MLPCSCRAPEAPWAGGSKGSARCWGVVLVLYMVMVSLEAACQDGGTWLWALYLPGPSWGYVVVSSTATRALAGPCFSEPHCSLLGVRPPCSCRHLCPQPLQEWEAFPGVVYIIPGFCFLRVLAAGRAGSAAPAPVAALAGSAQSSGHFICHRCPSSPPRIISSVHSPHRWSVSQELLQLIKIT